MLKRFWRRFVTKETTYPCRVIGSYSSDDMDLFKQLSNSLCGITSTLLFSNSFAGNRFISVMPVAVFIVVLMFSVFLLDKMLYVYSFSLKGTKCLSFDCVGFPQDSTSLSLLEIILNMTEHSKTYQ